MKKKYVSEIKFGEQIDDIFLLLEKKNSIKKNGDSFIITTLGDKTGQIKAVMWKNFKHLSNTPIGSFIHISAFVNEFNGIPQLSIKETISIDENKIKIDDFLPKTKKNINSMFNHLKSIINSIKNYHLKQLFELFWNDSEFIEQFKLAPAAKYIHHAYIGGLLEHTLSMLIIGDQISKHYDYINKELLISGIFLHDIGKIKELKYKQNIDYTDEGRLLNHIIIGISILGEKIKQINNFPKQIEYLLKHMIVSHHGLKEFGSPEPPKTMEAILLNCIDEMDFKVNNAKNHVDSDLTEGSWTSYNRISDRQLYKKSINIK